jgi:hypothetical protein
MDKFKFGDIVIVSERARKGHSWSRSVRRIGTKWRVFGNDPNNKNILLVEDPNDKPSYFPDGELFIPSELYEAYEEWFDLYEPAIKPIENYYNKSKYGNNYKRKVAT